MLNTGKRERACFGGSAGGIADFSVSFHSSVEVMSASDRTVRTAPSFGQPMKRPTPVKRRVSTGLPLRSTSSRRSRRMSHMPRPIRPTRRTTKGATIAPGGTREDDAVLGTDVGLGAKVGCGRMAIVGRGVVGTAVATVVEVEGRLVDGRVDGALGKDGRKEGIGSRMACNRQRVVFAAWTYPRSHPERTVRTERQRTE